MIKRTLYFSQSVYLSLNARQLVMRIPDVEKNPDRYSPEQRETSVRTFPIEDIGMVILDNKQITITHALMDALLQNNCALVTCDERSMPSGLYMPLESHTLQAERFGNQIEASLPLRKQLWQQTIKQKILNQAAVLEALTDAETRCMRVWAGDVKSGDSENLEARAAAYYWKNLFIPYGIKGFVRGRELDPPNNLLNYGYAILRAIIARSLVGSGLLPTFGIHHHSRYNAYPLADDIMEPYRPYVDRIVVDIINSSADINTLTRDLKAKFLSLPTTEVMINNQRSPLMIAASTTTASLAKCYGGESRKLVYPVL